MDNTIALNILAAGIATQQQILDAMKLAYSLLETGYESDVATVAALQSKPPVQETVQSTL